MEIENELNWLFNLNQNKDQFKEFILSQDKDFFNLIVELVRESISYNIKGLQEKFGSFGFNENEAQVDIYSRLCELEVGLFLSKKGEKVRFLEGQSSPDLVSGNQFFNKIWEVSSIFNNKELRRLWIKTNKIIKDWDIKVEAKIDLSNIFSGFQPKMKYHKAFRDIVDNSLKELRKYDPKNLSNKKTDKLKTPAIFYDFKKINKNYSGISTMVEGGIERMATLDTDNLILPWIAALKDRICNKSNQLKTDIKKIEDQNKNIWDQPNYRLIAIVSDKDIFYDNYLIQTCFGSYNIHSDNLIADERLEKINNSNPWYEYIKNYFYYLNGSILKKPEGVFLINETKSIHGILFISTNQIPVKHKFYCNPFVEYNNVPNLLKYMEFLNSKRFLKCI